MKKIFNIAIVAAMVLSLTGCEDFLNRPTIDGYSTGSFYKNDAQCEMGVNYLYNSPWYDFIRGFLAVGDCMAGNYYDATQGFQTLTPQYGEAYSTNMSKSLWSVIGHCQTVIDNIAAAQGPSSEAKRKYIGEALVWKAIAYFYLVRIYDEIPIIHQPATLVNDGTYNEVYKNTRANAYEYILVTLEEAEKLLPKTSEATGRIDYWGARGIEAKVYLTMAGMSGELNQDYLKKAFEISKDVIENSGRHLLTDYESVFFGENNINSECLISWMWGGKTSDAAGWTAQNSFQNDLAFGDMGPWGDNWGHWKGVTVDLQKAFGIEATMDPREREKVDKDRRRHATYMLPGDVYPQFWRAHTNGGLDILEAIYNKDYALYGFQGTWGVGTGTHCCVKHCYGDNEDHMAMFGYVPARNMTSAMATHLLRLSDVMLVNAEAAVLGGGDIAYGCARLNDVRRRSIKDYKDVNGYTFENVWKERRLEFAMEGDRWYDLVRLSYYNPDAAVNELKNQYRGVYDNHDATFKQYWTSRHENPNNPNAWIWDTEIEDGQIFQYQKEHPMAYQAGITKSVFKFPLYDADVIFNAHLASTEPAQSIDVRATFKYDFSNL